jgi:hypothetical protein
LGDKGGALLHPVAMEIAAEINKAATIRTRVI